MLVNEQGRMDTEDKDMMRKRFFIRFLKCNAITFRFRRYFFERQGYDCAKLIAKRNFYGYLYLFMGFSWRKTDEGLEFWKKMDEGWGKIYNMI